MNEDRSFYRNVPDALLVITVPSYRFTNSASFMVRQQNLRSARLFMPFFRRWK